MERIEGLDFRDVGVFKKTNNPGAVIRAGAFSKTAEFSHFVEEINSFGLIHEILLYISHLSNNKVMIKRIKGKHQQEIEEIKKGG